MRPVRWEQLEGGMGRRGGGGGGGEAVGIVALGRWVLSMARGNEVKEGPVGLVEARRLSPEWPPTSCLLRRDVGWQR